MGCYVFGSIRRQRDYLAALMGTTRRKVACIDFKPVGPLAQKEEVSTRA